MKRSGRFLHLSPLVFLLVLFSGCSDNKNPLNEEVRISAKPTLGAQAICIPISCAVDNVKLMNGTETIYEDAEDGLINGWFKEPENPAAIIMNLYDPGKDSRVISFFDGDTGVNYVLGNGIGNTVWSSLWNNTSRFVISWEGIFKYFFEVRVMVEVKSGGYRTLYYTPINYSLGFLNYGSGYVHIGIGMDKYDGTWHTITRNLQEDLNSSPQCANDSIKAVHLFKIRCKCPCTPPPPESSEAHTIGFWSSNIQKILEGRTNGIQVSPETMNAYLNLIHTVALSPFSTLTLIEAYDILKNNDSEPIVLMKKQLLASEFNYVASAYMNGDSASTLEMITLGETMLLNPSGYSDQQILELKDLFDNFNNGLTIVFP